MADISPYQAPHRKPVGAVVQPSNKMPLNIAPTRQYPTPAHTHSRTISSNIFPAPTHSQPQNTYSQAVNHSRRSASTATVSTMSSQGGPNRSPSAVSITLRRNTSVRSAQSVTPTSYVALMRKQKATVWCDRAQYEDPRLAAAAKQAKMRATLEVVGGPQPRTSTSTSAGGSTTGMRSKITNRHHGAAKAVGYSANLLGTSGVPMRLSASEVGDEENSGDDAHSQDFRGQRSGSGRSSLRNSGRLSTLNQRQPGRLSTGSTPPSGQGSSPAEPTQDTDTPVAGTFKEGAVPEDYFQHPPGNGSSGSSGESESKFGNVGDMQAPKASNEGKGVDDLSRRGSVDERATTMRHAVRLFVANPDLSD
ncbi:MAG: hypothetical protein LQ340_001789 [Diploschistes diacapsis]|nr:MAG: hypothetical protein LQ340_001789 [Diploschistes diacapsis]